MFKLPSFWKLLTLWALLALPLAGCQGMSADEIEVTIAAQTDWRVRATIQSAPPPDVEQPTPYPQATPLPTFTPWPTVAVEFIRYATEAEAHVARLRMATADLIQLTAAHPETVATLNWQAEAARQLSLFERLAQAVAVMNRPAHYAELHQTIAQLPASCLEASGELAARLAAAEADEAVSFDLTAVNNLLTSCNAELATAVDALHQAEPPIAPTTVAQATAAPQPGQPAPQGSCDATTVGLPPLSELGVAGYQGFAGGLYPNGSNQRPSAHEQAGVALAQTIRPLNAAGEVDEAGYVLVLGLGRENTEMIFRALQRQINPRASGVSRRLTLLDVVSDDMSPAQLSQPEAAVWQRLDDSLQADGYSPEQVQIVWLRLTADRDPHWSFPDSAETAQNDLRATAQRLKAHYPNLKLLYLAGPAYGGYGGNEPAAYEANFAIKWLIEEQIDGRADLQYDAGFAPWLSWGGYLWADGLTARADGLQWQCDDFSGQRLRISPSGRDKIANLLFNFFMSDPSAAPWFRADG
jgi:hypothetical protein